MKKAKIPKCRQCSSEMTYCGPAETTSHRAQFVNGRVRRTLAQWGCSNNGHQMRYAYTRWHPFQYGVDGWGFTSLDEAIIAARHLNTNVGIKVFGTPTVLSAKRLQASDFDLVLWNKDRQKLLKGQPEYSKNYRGSRGDK